MYDHGVPLVNSQWDGANHVVFTAEGNFFLITEKSSIESSSVDPPRIDLM